MVILEDATVSIIHTLPGVMRNIEALVGGIFGIYVILLIVRWYQGKQQNRILEEIRSEVRAIGKRMGTEPELVSKRKKIVRGIRKLGKAIEQRRQ
ncbi:hypothetical protein HZB01_03320 [Candidatus Woesearchaeota archaeon]|nr:hypothetical protein [Candidatus Woesearchaeota archaeon]